MSNMPTQWALIGKLDAYRDKGAPQPTKHLRVIHNGYCQQIHRHVCLRVNPRVNVRLPKVPEPRAYGSEENIEAFEGWLGNILRWFSINRYCGPDFDRDCVVCTVMFLESAALTWYGDNIDGGSHRNCEWSFKEVAIGLYDCFIRQGALRSASDTFQSATYIPEEGVMAFYHRMTWYAA